MNATGTPDRGPGIESVQAVSGDFGARGVHIVGEGGHGVPTVHFSGGLLPGKDQLGWADFQVRSDTAIRRHQALVNCAFCFCWDAWFHDHPAPRETADPRRHPAAERGGPHAALPPPAPSWPRALRAIRAWLSPWIALQRWWQAWSNKSPPPQLQALMDSVAAGRGLHLYIPN
jgi:hypothetical protein